MKDNLLDKTCITLLKRGYAIRCLPRKWFDVVARKSERILIIKVLLDANSISPDMALEMRRLAGFIGASPLIVAEKAGDCLEDNVVYQRFGVFTINMSTLENSIDDKLPMIHRNQSGLTVSIDGERLSSAMKDLGISLSSLSKRIGVSRQMVARYSSEKAEVSVQKAEAFYGLFGDRVFEKINIFESKTIDKNVESKVAKKYEALGFSASDARRAPFDIVARDEKMIILTDVGDKVGPEFSDFTNLIGADKLVIYDAKKPAGMPAITKEDFFDLKTARELVKFLKEFEQ